MLNGIKELSKELKATFLHTGREANGASVMLAMAGADRENILIVHGFSS